jgi:hypothetical protein
MRYVRQGSVARLKCCSSWYRSERKEEIGEHLASLLGHGYIIDLPSPIIPRGSEEVVYHSRMSPAPMWVAFFRTLLLQKNQLGFDKASQSTAYECNTSEEL